MMETVPYLATYSAEVRHPTMQNCKVRQRNDEDMSNVLGNQTVEELEVSRVVGDEITWTVSFSSSNLSYVSDWTCEELARITKYSSNVSLPEKEDVEKYFKTLCFLRVGVSRGIRLPLGHKPSYLKRIFVPARYAMILSMIGEVYYPEVAVRILPETNILETDIYSAEELQLMSSQLEKFFEDGLAGTMGISMDRYGDPHFMNKIAIISGEPQTCIKSMTKDNPLYGFLAWIMNAELLEVAYQEARYLLRVNYSEPTIYKTVGRRTWDKLKTATTKNDDDMPPRPVDSGVAE